MKIGVYGLGNLGIGVINAINQNKDMELVAAFSKRPAECFKDKLNNVAVYNASSVQDFKNKIDVLIVCAGSATDLPVLSPELTKLFNIVDSFDTHKNILSHYKSVNENALATNHTSLISCGWDPGLFSLNRLILSSILPNGNDYTFWGKGVSQGHSDAIRRIEGVLDARQYTIPIDEAINRVKNEESPNLTTREKHKRECFVVAKDGLNETELKEIETNIKTMPNYFADYDTTVHFITKEEMKEKHSTLPHGGKVIRTGKTGKNNEHKHICEFSLSLDSNPEFTASILVAYARAIKKLYDKKDYGCKTVFDIPPILLSPLDKEQLYSSIL